MSINLTDEIEVKTKKGKLGAAKQIFLEGDTQTVENEIQDINSRHNDLSSKHESLSSTVSEHTKQIESNQSQITANKSAQDEKNASLDANMAKLNTRDDQITELVKGVTATGGASVATAVTYDNEKSGLTAVNAQAAIDEVSSIGHFAKRGGIVNISTNYNATNTAEVLTLAQALSKVPSTDRVLGFQGKYLATNGWHTIIYIGGSLTSWIDTTKWIDLSDKILRSISENATFAGIATPTTNPGTPDGNVFYIAGEGTYTNFSEISVDKGELAVLTWNGTWSKQSLKVGLPPNELNISHLFPTNGEGGTNQYTIAGAIAQVPLEYRVQGLKVSFINESGVSETWEFLGNDWSIDNFSEVGARIISEAADKANKVAGGQTTDVFLFENLEDIEYIISSNKVIGNINSNWKGICLNVSEGDTLIYKLNGGSGKALYYTDSEDNLISDIQDNTSTEKQVIVPQGVTKAYVRTHYGATGSYIKHLYVSKGIIGDVKKLKTDVKVLDDKAKEIDTLNSEVKELKYILNPTIEKVECFKGTVNEIIQDIFLDARYTGENFISVGYFKHAANSGKMDLRIYQYNNEQGEQLLGTIYRNENISTDYSEKITIEGTNFKCIIDPSTLADKNVKVTDKTRFSDIVYKEHDGELNPPKGLVEKTDETLIIARENSTKVEGIKTNLSSVNDYVSELFEKRKRVIEMYPQGLTMCNIGDSFTYNNNHFYNKDDVPTYTKGYISRIIENLPFLHYYNCGRDGKRYVDWGNGGQAYELPMADIYTILLGTNDWNNPSSYKISVGDDINFENPIEDGTDYTIMGNLRKLLNRIYEKNQKAKVLIFNPVERVKFVFVNNKTNTQPGGWATDTPAKMTLKDYSLAIYNTIKDLDFADKYPTMYVKAVNLYEESNFTFYNIMKYIDVNGNKIVYPDSINDGYDGNTNDYPYPQSSEGYMYDGLHPNDSGNEVISLIMTKYIVDILLNSRYIINSVNPVSHNYYYKGVTTSVFVECDY